MQPSCSQPLRCQRLQACHQQRTACLSFPISQHLSKQHPKAHHHPTTQIHASPVPQSCHSSSSGARIKPSVAQACSTAGGIARLPNCLQQRSLGRQPDQHHQYHQKPWQQQDRCLLTHASRHMAGGLPLSQITVSGPSIICVVQTSQSCTVYQLAVRFRSRLDESFGQQ